MLIFIGIKNNNNELKHLFSKL